jgi:hypothetical protein
MKPGDMYAADSPVEEVYAYFEKQLGSSSELTQADLGSTAARVYVAWPFKYEEAGYEGDERTLFSFASNYTGKQLTDFPGSWYVGPGESVPGSAADLEDALQEQILDETLNDISEDVSSVGTAASSAVTGGIGRIVTVAALAASGIFMLRLFKK